MQNNTKNKLWIARNRSGLELKQVAHLISHKSPGLLSLYERGIHLPGLEIALKLEIIYKKPVQKLFKDLYTKCSREVRTVREGRPMKPANDPFQNGSKRLREHEFCAYDAFLKSNIPNQLELDVVTKHILKLNNVVTEYKGHQY